MLLETEILVLEALSNGPLAISQLRNELIRLMVAKNICSPFEADRLSYHQVSEVLGVMLQKDLVEEIHEDSVAYFGGQTISTRVVYQIPNYVREPVCPMADMT